MAGSRPSIVDARTYKERLTAVKERYFDNVCLIRFFVLLIILIVFAVLLDYHYGTQTVQTYQSAIISYVYPEWDADFDPSASEIAADALAIDSHRNSHEYADNLRYVFIDFGANSGDTFDRMMKGEYVKKEIPRRDIDAYLVEANPKHNKSLMEHYNNHRTIKGLYTETAAWIKDGTTVFYPDTKSRTAGSSSLSQNHRWANASHYYEVEVRTIDVCRWLREDVKATEDDYVCLKIDIEGAEYPIVQYMWDNRETCLKYINQMFAEWHYIYYSHTDAYHAIVNQTKKEMADEWMTKLAEYGIDMHYDYVGSR